MASLGSKGFNKQMYTVKAEKGLFYCCHHWNLFGLGVKPPCHAGQYCLLSVTSPWHVQIIGLLKVSSFLSHREQEAERKHLWPLKAAISALPFSLHWLSQVSWWKDNCFPEQLLDVTSLPGKSHTAAFLQGGQNSLEPPLQATNGSGGDREGLCCKGAQGPTKESLFRQCFAPPL